MVPFAALLGPNGPETATAKAAKEFPQASALRFCRSVMPARPNGLESYLTISRRTLQCQSFLVAVKRYNAVPKYTRVS